MTIHLRLPVVFFCMSLMSLSAELEKKMPLEITLHDSRGFSLASVPDKNFILSLFKSHTHLHFRISNASNQELVLWQPNSPNGDDAMIIEFRDPSVPRKVFRARPNWSYTGGMGLPKTFTLAAHDDLIVNIDFIGEMQWNFPMLIENDRSRNLEVRVGYHSQDLAQEKRKSFGRFKIAKVWVGKTVGEWQKILVRNRSGKGVGHRP